MKSSKSNALQHRRTRQDHATETAEDYVEAVAEICKAHGVCRVVDLAQKFAVSHVTVTKIIGRLKKEGLVDTEPYRPIELTPKGARLAEISRLRHEIVYEFLIALGVSPKVALIDSEGIEHHVSPETLQCFKKITAEKNKTK